MLKHFVGRQLWHVFVKFGDTTLLESKYLRITAIDDAVHSTHDKTFHTLIINYLIFLGLLRRNDDANRFPVGVLPLGRTNTIGNTLFPTGEGVEKVKQLIDASMAIIKGNTTWKDAMKVEPIITEEDTPAKPIFAMCSLEWGAFRDALARKHKYWMYGSLRDYATFIFNGYKESLNWHCSGLLKYTPPCSGCSNCIKKRPEIKRKWTFFMPNVPENAQGPDSSSLVNPECESCNEVNFQTSDFRIVTPNIRDSEGPPALRIAIGKHDHSYPEFVSEGWDRVKDSNNMPHPILARTVELLPQEHLDTTVIEIDREEYEAKPVKITYLPKVVKLFCSRPE